RAAGARAGTRLPGGQLPRALPRGGVHHRRGPALRLGVRRDAGERAQPLDARPAQPGPPLPARGRRPRPGAHLRAGGAGRRAHAGHAQPGGPGRLAGGRRLLGHGPLAGRAGPGRHVARAARRVSLRGCMMRFGFSHRPIHPFQRSIELYQYAEELGFDYAWVPDQQYFADPFACLAAAALSTRRITLGLAVTNPYTRHPALIARGIGVVDDLAGGRMILGLGAANRQQRLQPRGFPTPRTAARARETIGIVRKLLAGERVVHETRNYTLSGIQLNYRPRADIPIYLASRSPRVLELAGEAADGVLIEGLFTSTGLD